MEHRLISLTCPYFLCFRLTRLLAVKLVCAVLPESWSTCHLKIHQRNGGQWCVSPYESGHKHKTFRQEWIYRVIFKLWVNIHRKNQNFFPQNLLCCIRITIQIWNFVRCKQKAEGLVQNNGKCMGVFYMPKWSRIDFPLFNLKCTHFCVNQSVDNNFLTSRLLSIFCPKGQSYFSEYINSEEQLGATVGPNIPQIY